MKRIELTRGQIALVGDVDYEWLAKYKWCAWYSPTNKSFYAVRRASGGGRVYMHRAILGLKRDDGLYTDHINHDTLDNRRYNLRIVTNRQNMQNQKKQGTSKFPGIYWHKLSSKWMARIRVDKKVIYLGLYSDELEAAQAYRDACLWAEGLVRGQSLTKSGQCA